MQTPAWSPDGRKIAFVSNRDGNSEIYVINTDGTEQRNLTRQPASDSHPSWSRDGRKLAFVSRRDGNAEIYVMNADGRGLRNVTRSPSDDLDPAWSPNGRAIAFVHKTVVQPRVVHGRRIHGYRTSLHVVNADGSGLRRLMEGGPFSPRWSADGKTIRYGRFLVNADGSGHRELPRNVPLAGVWSPDGERVAVYPDEPGFDVGYPATWSLEEVERAHIERVLADLKGNVSLAARRLGISRTTLWRKMKHHDLSSPKVRARGR